MIKVAPHFPPPPHNHEPLAPALPRLSKLMTHRGLCSRREADFFIERGWVRVDGLPVRELGTRVREDAQIVIEKEALRNQREWKTIILNKPIGYVSSQAEDGYTPAIKLLTSERQFLSLSQFLSAPVTPYSPALPPLPPQGLRGLAVAGRLDIDSQGLLVFTQDGRIAKALVGEHSPIEKEYLVRIRPDLRKMVTPQVIDCLSSGKIDLDGQRLRPARVEPINEDQLRFVLREGKKRQIRRMCQAVGLDVVGLKRVRIGKVLLGSLPEGQWRFLNSEEKF